MTSYDPSNIFAKILRGEIPSHKVYEDEHVVAILDIMPQQPGHTLVVPKLASRNLLDADPAVLGAAIVAVQRLARAVKAAFAADGVIINQFNESAAGQTVFHLHFHVIPRHDDIPMKHHARGFAPAEDLAAAAAKIRAALAAT
ncbi:MAG: HIT domain-containing protein [Hyphomicrobiaceae bacterium]|nr:HIT domain-containing protein [Hyphomicrobiaceae bacterium]